MTERVIPMDDTEKDKLHGMQLQLVRIEEMLKPLSALVPAVELLKDVARDGAQRAELAHQRIDVLEPSAERARNAENSSTLALQRLDKIEDGQKWLWRTFAGAIVASVVVFIISGGLK